MTTQPLTLGARLLQLRDARDLTQAQVADACGITRPTMSRYEGDNVNWPQIYILRRLAEFYGVPEQELTRLVPKG